MKQKFIEWFTKNNNGCSPAMEDDRSFAHEKTQHMFEAYQAGVAEGEARCAALAAESAGLKTKAAELVHEASEVYSAYNSTISEPDGDFMDMQTLQEMQCVETPATDAFLAEVRAQGVEMMAAEADQLMNEFGDDSYKVMVTADLQRFANAFAAQLRKGTVL
ncbi:TPA: hypothetical protein MNC23_002260 [Citrobacter freundii]|uniref:hypothetical protein n=1 Tax=Citrobacter freundii TaxID=546 RepID=UPI000FDA88BD|nr:hypothetical protein [Citrobacter freundii]ELK1247696.1 hypothetical protein [Citrobacter freundii]ELR9591903.1 hypothetical protein [Citrobacter freundii]ELZ3593126.1 hypothetical protein [Citrobacter freundii]EMD6923476.1 hypothetical protein [Citrobacter freundii]MBJ8724852.1 hypothetical protein [Citrobacter freundii]